MGASENKNEDQCMYPAIGSEIRSRLQQFVEERMQTTMVQKLASVFSELKGQFTQK